MRPGHHHEVEVLVPPGDPMHPGGDPRPAIAIAMTVTVAELAEQRAARESYTLRALDRLRMRG